MLLVSELCSNCAGYNTDRWLYITAVLERAGWSWDKIREYSTAREEGWVEQESCSQRYRVKAENIGTDCRPGLVNLFLLSAFDPCVYNYDRYPLIKVFTTFRICFPFSHYFSYFAFRSYDDDRDWRVAQTVPAKALNHESCEYKKVRGSHVLRHATHSRSTKCSTPCLQHASLASRTNYYGVWSIECDETVYTGRNNACNEFNYNRQLYSRINRKLGSDSMIS